MLNSGFKVFGFQIDLARQIEKPQIIRNAILGMHEFGYNVCQLYLEDAYCFETHPGIARNHAYCKEFMQEIQSLCARQQMELIPVIPSLGHCAYITQKSGYERFDEGRGTGCNLGTVSPSFEETYDLLEDLYMDWCLHVPGQYLHVALDESPAMGEFYVRNHGREEFDRVRMFVSHCNRLNAICRSLNRRMIIWGDMLYYMPQAIEHLDKDIIIEDWYYYTFNKTPKIEAFNFADIDLSGDLKKAGFEVWGCPAIWPGFPFPPVKDRWQHVKDWVRYGKERQIEGLLITDWENCVGFYNNTDLLYRAMGRCLQNSIDDIETGISDTLQMLMGVSEEQTPAPVLMFEDVNQTAVLEKISITAIVRMVAAELMELGRFHVTGHADRQLFLRPLETLASKKRQDKCREKHHKLSQLFQNIRQLMHDAESIYGKSVINGLYLSWKFLELLSKIGTALPDCYEHLCLHESHRDEEIQKILLDLASESEQFAVDYKSHWCSVRYEDDPQPVGNWAINAAQKLKAWAKAIDPLDRENNPLITTARFECTLHCNHPALPIALIGLIWDDGYKQTSNEIMICFDSKYARPNVAWKQYPSIVMDRNSLPSQIVIEAVNYGQIGVEHVCIVQKGTTYKYKPVKTAGKNIKKEADIIWLGPICATVESPLLREDHDIAWFVRE